MVRQRFPALQPDPAAPIATTGLRNGSRHPAERISSETGLFSAGLLSCTDGFALGTAATVATAFLWPAVLTRATGLTATVFTVPGLVMTCTTADFGPALLAFTETEFGCEDALATGAAVGLTRTPTIGALFVAEAALELFATGFTADACAETVFVFESALAGFAACTETALPFAGYKDRFAGWCLR